MNWAHVCAGTAIILPALACAQEAVASIEATVDDARKGISATRDFVAIARLTPDQEAGTTQVVAPGAAARAQLIYDANSDTLAWAIVFEGLTDAPVGGHIHGPADRQSNAGILLDLLARSRVFPSSAPVASGIATGSISPLADSDLPGTILGEMAYINLHTSAHPAGEVRGQLVERAKQGFEARLDPMQAEPMPAGDVAAALGAAALMFDGTTLSWSVAYSGLTSPVSGVHIHTSAAIGETAGVAIALSGPIAGINAATIEGSVTDPDPAVVADLFAGRAYVNIHTETNPAGEIRGQIAPIVFESGYESAAVTAPSVDFDADVAVWLAQTHVQKIDGQPELIAVTDAERKLADLVGEPDLKLLKLVGGRDTLVKVDVARALAEQLDVPVGVTIDVLDSAGNGLWTGTPTPPQGYPESVVSAPGEVVHRFEDSFNVMVPGAHVIPAGITIRVTLSTPAGRVAQSWPVDVGAPIVLPVTMFDWNWYGEETRRLGDAVIDELGHKLPVRDMPVQRVDAVLPLISTLPHSRTEGGVTYRVPALIATSMADWEAQAEARTGVTWRYDRLVDQTQTWNRAMLYAGAQHYIAALHGNFTTRFGVFRGRGNSQMYSTSAQSNVSNARGIFAHEFSHNLDLFHWHQGDLDRYPYQGPMFGSTTSLPTNGTHGGPTWKYMPPGFDGSALGTFVPPDLPDGDGIRYRRVVSTARAQDDRPNGHEMGCFSDFDVRVTQQWLERQLRVWNGEFWATWNDASKAYDRAVNQTVGLNLPLDPQPQEVYSLLVAASDLVPDANLVYQPIGPYESGLIHRFDPRDSGERAAAASLGDYCPTGGCDYSVRVTQGGVESVFMLRADNRYEGAGPDGDNIYETDAVVHVAINMPAADGAIERVELLATPNAQVDGIGDAAVLATWVAIR